MPVLRVQQSCSDRNQTHLQFQFLQRDTIIECINCKDIWRQNPFRFLWFKKYFTVVLSILNLPGIHCLSEVFSVLFWEARAWFCAHGSSLYLTLCNYVTNQYGITWFGSSCHTPWGGGQVPGILEVMAAVTGEQLLCPAQRSAEGTESRG